MSKTRTTQEALEWLRSCKELNCGNLLDYMAKATQSPDAPIIFLEDGQLTRNGTNVSCLSFADVINIRKKLAYRLRALGVKEGDVVAVSVSDGILPFLFYSALASLGAAISLINSNIDADIGVSYIEHYGFRRLITDERARKSSGFIQKATNVLGDNGLFVIPAEWLEIEDVPPIVSWPVMAVDSRLLMISHTSGTTGIPKAVKFENRQFFMGKRVRIGRYFDDGEEKFLSVLPQSHSAAISHLETAILHGVPIYVASSQRVGSMLNAIEQFRPSIVASFPSTYAELAGLPSNAVDFSSVKRWLSMGDAAHREHIKKILNFSPESKFIEGFGSSELGMALLTRESSLGKVAPDRCIGRPSDIAIAKIMQMNGIDEAKDGEVGRLAVRSPSISPGYWKNLELDSRVWSNGYFLTGDLAYQVKGEFYLVDRALDTVFIDDVPIHTLPLEELLLRVDGVLDASVVGVKDDLGQCKKLVAIIRATSSVCGEQWKNADYAKNLLKKAVEDKVERRCDIEVIVRLVTEEPDLPVGATGKILKQRILSRFS